MTHTGKEFLKCRGSWTNSVFCGIFIRASKHLKHSENESHKEKANKIKIKVFDNSLKTNDYSKVMKTSYEK